MGLFRRIAAANDYVAMRDKLALEFSQRMRTGGEEVFEVLLDLWKTEMRRRGRNHLALPHIGMNYVKFAALPQFSPTEMIDLCAQLLGWLAIKGFQETRFWVDLNVAVKPLVDSMQADGGSALNEAFRQLNPRSCQAIQETLGMKLFSHLEHRAFLDNLLAHRD